MALQSTLSLSSEANWAQMLLRIEKIMSTSHIMKQTRNGQAGIGCPLTYLLHVPSRNPSQPIRTKSSDRCPRQFRACRGGAGRLARTDPAIINALAKSIRAKARTLSGARRFVTLGFKCLIIATSA